MHCRAVSTPLLLAGFLASFWPIGTFAVAQSVPQPVAAPVEPVEFPDEIPAEPVEIPVQLSPMEPEEISAEVVESENTSAVPQPVATWRLFTSEGDRFRVAMPSPPAEYSFATEPEADGSSRMYMQMQLVDAAHLEIYAAAFVESAGFSTVAGSVESAAMDCALSLGSAAQLEGSRALTGGAYNGAEALFLKPDNGLQVSRCYVVGDRAYMLTATREPFNAGTGLQPLTFDNSSANTNAEASLQEPQQQQSPTMEAFFGSFEILSE